jgi:hypothetical protein
LVTVSDATPARASRAEAVSPAGPAPTTRTSVLVVSMGYLVVVISLFE